MQENNRLLLATAICIFIMMGWGYVFPYAQKADVAKNTVSESQVEIAHKEILQEKDNTAPQQPGKELPIRSAKLNGSINLRGAFIEKMVLNGYKNSVTPDSPDVDLLRGRTADEPYYLSFGLKINKENSQIEIPQKNTMWEADNDELAPGKPLNLRWTNRQGIEFTISLQIVEDYLLSARYSVINRSQSSPHFIQYLTLNRSRGPANNSGGVSTHEGGVIVQGSSLIEISFSDISDKNFDYKSDIDWAGFSDKYWLSAIVPAEGKINHSKIESYMNISKKQRRFFIEVDSGKIQAPAAQTTVLSSNYIFLGPKVVDILDSYSRKYNIELFDRAVDFGYLYFITKPLFRLLVFFNNFFNNFGLAILFLTIFVKLALFPLSYKGFKNIEKLKRLSPEIQRIKETYEGKPELIQKYTIALYKQENANPASGCLPILVQMPIFFALYKVFCVAIEMRHAPIFGWVKDLSATDPLSIFNLFGLINWNPPSYLMIGPIALFMAATMFIQQKLSPQPTDQTQATMMAMMPLIVLLMVSSFPAGLLIYWSWSNILSIVQQLVIKYLSTDSSANSKL